MALPNRIVEAAARARDTRNTVLQHLTRRARALLAYLVEHASNTDPTQTIRQDDNYVAGRLGCSRRTVLYSLDDLHTAGLLVRPVQARRRGRFAASGYQLTTKAVDILFASPCAKSADEIKHTAPIPIGLNKPDKDRPVRNGRYTLPPDLQVWVDRAVLTANDIVLLMYRAKRVGQRLQDLLTVTRDALLSGAIERPIAYLTSLLQLKTDWRFVARSTAAKHAKVNELEQGILARDQLLYEAGQRGGMVWISDAGTSYSLSQDGVLRGFQNGATRSAFLTPSVALHLLRNGNPMSSHPPDH